MAVTQIISVKLEVTLEGEGGEDGLTIRAQRAHFTHTSAKPAELPDRRSGAKGEKRTLNLSGDLRLHRGREAAAQNQSGRKEQGGRDEESGRCRERERRKRSRAEGSEEGGDEETPPPSSLAGIKPHGEIWVFCWLVFPVGEASTLKGHPGSASQAEWE